MEFNEGFKYLGFILKPNICKSVDWGWLLEKIEDEVNAWYNKLLPIGGRLALVKFVIEVLPLYWHSIAHIPKGILEKN